MSIPTAIHAKEAKGTKEVKEYGDSEVTLHNELKHKSIFLRDFTTAAQMLWQVLHRCFGRCCAGASTVAAQMFRQVLWQVLRQVLYRCFGRCCADASAGVAQMLRQVLRRCFGRCFGRCCDRCCADASTGAVQMLRQVLRPGCERCLACGHRSGVECRDKGNGWRGR